MAKAKEEIKEVKESLKEPEVEVSNKVEIEVEKDVIREIPTEEEAEKGLIKKPESAELSAWQPKTSIGKKVKSGEIRDIAEILGNGHRILEQAITDVLLPGLETDLLLIGQSKGKFGGGQRRIFKQVQKKTCEGNKPKFATVAVVGNRDGYVGVGYGKSKETVPAREKSMRNAKLNVFQIRRGCGAWQCGCKEPHSIPFTVTGKCGSIVIKLMPAPKGKGLIINKECKKILRLAGIKDVWSKTLEGHTESTVNLVYACVDALRNLTKMKLSSEQIEKYGIISGKIPNTHNKSG
jgi:small subunit ribosomal protein S5